MTDNPEEEARALINKYFLKTTVSHPPRKTIVTPSKMKKQAPQEVVDSFWTKFNTTTPGLASTVLPIDSYAKKVSDASQKGQAEGRPASASYEEAVRICKLKVAKISKECRRVNQKYRDSHFDIEFDLKWGTRDCLETLAIPNRKKSIFKPGSVKRVGDIFEDPQFYIGAPSARDVRQGQDGDCWLMAALCTLTNKSGLIERICVARDELVGVYGFVFYRDSEWRSEIIDDKLYLTRPDYDESVLERVLWEDRERVHSEEEYRKVYQTGSGALYFAQCENQNETWLPLLEKAYAKAHGDFAAIEGGFTGEGIEDLTGGVTVELFTTDILDKDAFWKNELLRVNEEFLFGCAASVFRGWGDRKGIKEGHAYSIMRAVEIDGHRLCLLQNPWGKGEWTGPWSDGSKEWTPEWMSKLSHRFGNDGAFWISYQDLLRKYQTFDRTRLFDDTWNVTHQWATVRVPWTVDYHDTKFSFTISKPSSVVVVLNQLNTRYFKGMSGQYSFELGFRLHKAGEEDYIVRSRGNYCMSRSVSAEVDLDEAGEYLVLIKVKAERDFTALPVENVIRDNAKDRRDKLLRIGLAYDLAHAKGQLEESKEDKARREKAEARKKAKERQEHKTKLTDEKKQRKRSEKKKQKRQKLAEERAAAKLAKLAAKEERKKMSEENRDLIIVPQGTPIANPPIRILKTQDLANVQEHKNCSECANVDSVSERVVLDTVGSPTEHESSPEGGKAAESVATSTDDLGTPVPTIGPSKTVTFDLPMVSNTPGGFLSSNVSVFGSGTETAQGDSVRADDGLSPSNSTPATRQNSIAALASRSNDITQQIMSSSPDEPQFKEPFGTPPLSKDAKELLEIKRQAIRFLTEEDTDTGSDVSSIPSSAIEESIAAAKRPPPTEPAPAKSDEKKKEEEEDEFEKDPWNAVCVVGLRVYAKALETKKAKDSMNSSSTLEGHLCGSVVGEKHGDEKAADDADEDDGKVILTPTSEDEKELGKMASMSSADIGFEELKQEAEKQNFQAFEKTEKMKSDLVEVTIRVVRPNSWEDGEASLDVDDSAMDATKNLDGKDNRRESVMGARGRLGSTILVKGTDDGKK